MNTLGIYFGPKLISLVGLDGKKLAGTINIPINTVTANPLDEKVPEQFKIATVIKDELRKNAIDVKSADVVLPGKDLIIRTFHMPLLSPDELANAVRFEVKKYIPFKVEDLVSDFQVKIDKTTRKNFVLFVGMKKDILDKYRAVFSQLDLKLNSVEYAGFGILRLLKLAKVKEKGIVALINADLAEDDEVNFVVLEDGFPLFSRDIVLANEAVDPATSAKTPVAENIEKLKIELRISLDFYLRKFPTKNIQVVTFIAPEEHRVELESFIKERGLTAKFINCNTLADKPVAFSSGFLKAYACSLNRTVKDAVSIDLLTKKSKKRGGMPFGGGLSSMPFLSQIKVDFRMVAFGACIIALPYLIHSSQKQPVERQLQMTKSSRPAVSSAVSSDADLSSLQAIDAGFKEKITAVKQVLRDRRLLTSSLDAVPRVTGKGLWLSSVSFQSLDKGYVLTMSGSVYLGDSSKEMQAVNKFISDLRNTPAFNQSFGDISVLSMDEGKIDDVLLTNFKIACRSQ